MSEENTYYCSLYVDTDLEENVLADNLAKAFNTKASKSYVRVFEGNFDIWENDEFDAKMRNDELDGFLYYRYRLEVDANTDLGEENAVAFVGKILEHLWSQNYPAVASCGYEELLPNNGGYKNPNVPRPQ